VYIILVFEKKILTRSIAQNFARHIKMVVRCGLVTVI